MKKIHFSLIGILCVFLVGTLFYEYKKINSDTYRVIFLENSLGDASLIITPEGKSIVIDTGSDEAVAQKIAQYQGIFHQKIDALILSHEDSDHSGGAPEILKKFHVKHIFLEGIDPKNSLSQAIWKAIDKQNIPYTFLSGTKDFKIDDHLVIDTLMPREENLLFKSKNNNDSLVFFLTFFGKKVLFTGDIEQAAEQELLLSGEDIHADILKVPHHGSKTSSSEEFITAVDPKYAVAIAEKVNQFGHPHKEVVERYQAHHVNFLQTGIEGDVSFCISEKRQEFTRCDFNE